MNIKELKFRNIGSYGNKEQEIKFYDKGSLNLIVGKNGAGKCVHPDTNINVKFKDKKLNKRFIKFINSKVL